MCVMPSTMDICEIKLIVNKSCDIYVYFNVMSRYYSFKTSNIDLFIVPTTVLYK